MRLRGLFFRFLFNKFFLTLAVPRINVVFSRSITDRGDRIRGSEYDKEVRTSSQSGFGLIEEEIRGLTQVLGSPYRTQDCYLVLGVRTVISVEKGKTQSEMVWLLRMPLYY